MTSFIVTPLAVEISKEVMIDSVLWILVATLMKIYNEKGQAQQ